MTLFEGQENKIYKISAIETDNEVLKHRFLSLGIAKDSRVVIERFSSKKATLAIQINNVKIALRDTEAQHIVVEAI